MAGERFNVAEKDLLVNLVIEHKSVLENKKTDAISCAAKIKSWQEIEKKFNSHGFVTKRPWKPLRKAWENIKARRKKAIAEESRQRMETGGGPFLPNLHLERNPESEVTIPFIAHCISGVGDSNVMSESQDYSLEFVNNLSEVQMCIVSPSGTGLSAVEPISSSSVEIPGPVPVASTSSRHSSCVARSAAVERELDVRIKKVKRATEFESMLDEKRMMAAELEIKIKEAELQLKEESLKQLREEGKRSKEAHMNAMFYLRVEHEQRMLNLRSLGSAQPKP